ncbi:hypothetical protein C0J52_25489 [Blattella germanica]|nr:hypothetical protein C0J52_25489 [Blattella germanica]
MLHSHNSNGCLQRGLVYKRLCELFTQVKPEKSGPSRLYYPISCISIRIQKILHNVIE